MNESMDCGTITIRLIRSFPHRNIKHVVLKNVDLNQTVKEFQDYIRKDIQTRSDLPVPFKRHTYDTLKIEHKPHGAKSNNLVINIEDEETSILMPDKTLKGSLVVTETDISFFKLDDYVKYKENPSSQW